MRLDGGPRKWNQELMDATSGCPVFETSENPRREGEFQLGGSVSYIINVIKDLCIYCRYERIECVNVELKVLIEKKLKRFILNKEKLIYSKYLFNIIG